MNKLHKKLKMSIYGRLKTRMKRYEEASNDQIIYQKGHFLLFTIYTELLLKHKTGSNSSMKVIKSHVHSQFVKQFAAKKVNEFRALEFSQA